jgi:peptidyl-prolyl cis-trans isomerase C
MLKTTNKPWIFLYLFLLFVLVSCSGKANPTITATLPTETPIPQPPTPTSLPMAVRINGEGILLSDYQEEYSRLDSALKSMGKTLTPEEMKTRVLDDLVGTELLNQEAKKNGFVISDADLNAEIDKLSQSMGGVEAFSAWKQSMSFTDESFKRSMFRSLGSAWERDQIIKSLPETAEQVHARQIFFSREESATSYRQKVDAGSDFAVLAQEADPVTVGDLGWFPKGYLLQPEVEEAAFSLQPGEVSGVIKSAIGFHLVQVIEKDAARPVDPDAKTSLQRNAITDWVKQAKAKSQIEISVP